MSRGYALFVHTWHQEHDARIADDTERLKNETYNHFTYLAEYSLHYGNFCYWTVFSIFYELNFCSSSVFSIENHGSFTEKVYRGQRMAKQKATIYIEFSGMTNLAPCADWEIDHKTAIKAIKAFRKIAGKPRELNGRSMKGYQ